MKTEMGLEKVEQEIRQDAEKEAEEILEEAEEKAEEILESAREEAETIREKAREEAENEKEAIERKKLSNARMKARQSVLKAKEEKIDEAFREFRDRLSDLEDERREEFVISAIEQTGFEVESAEGSDHFTEFLEDEGIDVESWEKEGFRLFSAGGDRSRDFSFDRIVDTIKEKERKRVSEVLFEE